MERRRGGVKGKGQFRIKSKTIVGAKNNHAKFTIKILVIEISDRKMLGW